MSRTIARWTAPLAFAIAVGMIACGDDKPDTLAEDTSLSRDLQMANADTSVQPALQDVPAGTSVTPTPVAPTPAPRTRAPARKTSGAVVRTPARVTPTPAPAPTTATTSSGNTVTRTSGGSERAVGSIAAGSTLSMTSNSRICTNTNRVGQRFNATVSETVTGSNGARIPAGATASIEITELKRSENANDNVVMGFRVISVSFGGRTYPVDATTQYARVEKVRNQPRDKDVQKVVGGAAVGAIIGQVLGKSTKSTVIGAATGAAAGTAAAVATANFEGCVPDGGRITVSLDAPMQVQA